MSAREGKMWWIIVSSHMGFLGSWHSGVVHLRHRGWQNWFLARLCTLFHAAWKPSGHARREGVSPDYNATLGSKFVLPQFRASLWVTRTGSNLDLLQCRTTSNGHFGTLRGPRQVQCGTYTLPRPAIHVIGITQMPALHRVVETLMKPTDV